MAREEATLPGFGASRCELDGRRLGGRGTHGVMALGGGLPAPVPTCSPA